jgi:hypothetical protein
LREGDFVMVFVIENVEDIREERMDVVQLRERVNDSFESLLELLRTELYLSHVKLPDSSDCIIGVHL